MLTSGSAMHLRSAANAQALNAVNSLLSEHTSSSTMANSNNQADLERSEDQVAVSDDSDEDSDEDQSSDESSGEIHKCPRCDKAYSDAMSLNVCACYFSDDPLLLTSTQRHLKDKR